MPEIEQSAGRIPVLTEAMTLEDARRFLGIPTRKHRKTKLGGF